MTVVIVFLLNSLGVNLALAQVITNIAPDTTLPTNSVILPNGNVFNITAGTSVGNNLFHSFQDFNVGSGDTANFVDPGGIANILSRVTGKNVSNIFGQLRSDSSANLFFLNSNGIVFGPNSSLDVGGSFHVSTANFVKLGEGPGSGMFNATSPELDILTSSPPTAFGFLGANPPSLPFNSELNSPTTAGVSIHGLTSLQDSPIIIVGRDGAPPEVRSSIEGIEIRGKLFSKGGKISLASVGDEGEVPINDTLDDVSLFSNQNSSLLGKLGEIHLETGSIIDSSPSSLFPSMPNELAIPNGSIHIQGGRLRMVNSKIFGEMKGIGSAFEPGDGKLKGGPITLALLGKSELTQSEILTSSEGFGLVSGDIFVTASELILTKSSHIRSTIFKTEIGEFDDGSGDISLAVDTISLGEKSTIDNRSESLENISTSGSLNIFGKIGPNHKAKSVTLDSGIIATGAARGKKITILSEDLILRNQSLIQNSTVFGVEDRDFDNVDAEFKPAIELKVDHLHLEGGSAISSFVSENVGARENVDQSPSIRIIADESITITGQQNVNGENIRSRVIAITKDQNDGGDITLTTPLLSVEDHGLITTDATVSNPNFFDGNAGNITINANSINLNDGASITSNNAGLGKPGTIKFNAVSDLKINMEDSNQPLSNDLQAVEISTSGTHGGESGDIIIDVHSFNATNFSITSENDNSDFNFDGPIDSANPGQITIRGIQDESREGTEFAQLLSWSHATISTNVQGTRQGGEVPGNISISANNLLLKDGTTIESSTQREHVAGNIEFNVENLRTNVDENNVPLNEVDPVIISTNSSSTGNAGNIVLNVGALTTQGTTEISSSSLGRQTTGNAGSITVQGQDSTDTNSTPVAGTIALSGTEISTTAEGTGKGGEIIIKSNEKIIIDQSNISATVNNREAGITEGGGGNITLEAGTELLENPDFSAEQLLVNNESLIEARSLGSASAGDITLIAKDTLRIQGNSELNTSNTNASAGDAGGNIKLTADFLIHTIGSTVSSDVRGEATTTGGNIVFDPQFVILQSSNITANADQGGGGTITINASVATLIDSFTTLDVGSQFGGSGTIDIQAPLQNLSGTIAPLPETIIQTATLYGAQCAAQKGGEFSSLNIRGRDRIPFEPGDYLFTPLLLNKRGENLLKRSLPSTSPMASRLRLSALNAHPLDVFTSFVPGAISLGIFADGCRS